MNTNNNVEVFDPMAWANLSNEKNSNASSVATTQVSVHDDDTNREQISSIVNTLVSRGIDITSGYGNWLNLGFALADGLGEEGRAYYHDLSRMNGDYNVAECDKQYNACLRSNGQGVTIKTFFQMAKDAGINISDVARQAARLSATYAIAPYAKSTEKVGKSTDFGVLNNGMADGGLAEVAENTSDHGNGYTFSDKLNIEDLADFFQPIFKHHGSEPAKCDAQLLGILDVASGIMGAANGTPEERSGIYGIYDGKRVFAPVYVDIFSGAGNDKGNLIFCKYLFHYIKAEMRRKYEAEKSTYDMEMAEWEAKGKKDRGPAPKEPVFRDPFVPGNSSSSAVYRAMDANDGWGVMFETEADTISNMIASDYGDYSDLMRKAHHHERATMNRVTEKLHIEIEEPRLAIFLTCTPGQLPALFPSFENGLGSRFLFYNIPDEDVVFHDVFAMTETPLEDVYKKMGEEILPLYHAMLMRKGHPIQFVMSQSQQREFLDTYRGILQEQFKMLGKGIRAFVFRMALECFRYAMILTTIRRLSDWQRTFNPSDPEQTGIFRDEENALICDDRDFRAAMTIMGCLINHTARVYAVMAKEDDNPFAVKGIKLTAEEVKVYNALPEGDFRTANFTKIAAGMKVTERTAQRMLGKFCNVYRIVNPVKRGVYNKPERKEANNE